MSKLAQGTQVYFRDPATDEIVAVECATSFNPGGNPAEQIEDTCLEDMDRSYQPGLRTPGQASLTINADPENASHIQLHDLANANPPPVLEWFVGWSDGTEPPTIIDGEVTLPETRTWFTFQGYVADFPLDFQANTVVTSNVSIQRSGGSAWIPKSTAAGGGTGGGE